MLYDNPAAALQAILERGVSEKQDQSCHIVWSRILELEPDEPGGLFAKLSAVMDLPRRTLVLLQASFPSQVSAASVWMSPIETGFMQQQLNGQWGSFSTHIQPYCIAQLSLTAELIQTRLGAELMSGEDLVKALADLGELQKEIDCSTLDKTLKAYLCRGLSDLQHAIRNYRISGALPILTQTEAMIGHSLLDPSYSSFLKSHALGSRLLENLSAMANLLTVAVSLPQLTQAIGGYLLK
jgi:hypothetical protein